MAIPKNAAESKLKILYFRKISNNFSFKDEKSITCTIYHCHWIQSLILTESDCQIFTHRRKIGAVSWSLLWEDLPLNENNCWNSVAATWNTELHSKFQKKTEQQDSSISSSETFECNETKWSMNFILHFDINVTRMLSDLKYS